MTKREESKNEALDRRQEEFIKAVGERIRQSRTRAGLTQAELATNAGVKQPWMVAVEGGSQNLTLGTLYRIATALNVSPRSLLPEMTGDAPSDETVVRLLTALGDSDSALGTVREEMQQLRQQLASWLPPAGELARKKG